MKQKEVVETFARHDGDGPLHLHVEALASKSVLNSGPTLVAYGPLDSPAEVDGIIRTGEEVTFTRSVTLRNPGFTTLTVTTIPPPSDDEE